MKHKTFTLFIALTLTIFTLPLPSSAKFSEEFTAIPANPNTVNTHTFIFEARPGETIKDVLYIRNLSKNEAKLKIYGADKLEESETFALKTKDTQSITIGKWLSPKKTQIKLQGNQDYFLPFTLVIPKDTALDKYEGGIVVEASNSSTGTITITKRIGVKIDLTVTNNPVPPQKIFKEKNFWERINKTHLIFASILLLTNLGLLGISYKQASKKRH